MTPGIKKMISTTTHVEDLRKQAYREGMLPIRVSGLNKVAQGKTSFDEILKVTPAPLME